jgi:Na+-driven multidrug efflux pump
MSNLLRFSVPLLIGNFAQQLYATVDSIVVGRYVGDKALSAVGASMPIINLLLVLFMAIATGAGIMVAQYFGAKDKESLSKSVGNALTLLVIASLMITTIGVTSAGSLLRLINTPEETFDMAKSYLTIIFGGILAAGMYNITSGILRGLGNSTFPLLTLLLSSVPEHRLGCVDGLTSWHGRRRGGDSHHLLAGGYPPCSASGNSIR